jgi:hypothetical protein
MPQTTSLSRRSGTSTLGRELRAASRRELATLKRELKDKHRDRMKRARSQESKDRRKKLVVAAVEVSGTAAAAGAARAYLGDKMDIGPLPLELPVAIAGHLVGGYFYPDDERGDHVHNLSNGMMAVAAFQGAQRMTTWARERMRQRSAEGAPGAGATAGASYPGASYPGTRAGALPPPPSLALPPPPLPPPLAYAQAAAGAAPVRTAADRAMAEAIRVMEDARRG